MPRAVRLLVGVLLVMSFAGLIRAATPQQAPVRVGGDIREPKRLKNVPPVYPADAARARVQGIVILEVVIGVSGKVTDARVLRSAPMLDQAALDAVRQWEYEVTEVNGRPVPVVMVATVNFNLSANAPRPSSTLELRLVRHGPAPGDAILRATNGVVPPNTEIVRGPDTSTGAAPDSMVNYLLDKDAVVTARDVLAARPILDEFNQPAISITLNSDGQARLRAATAANVGRKLAIVVNGQVRSTPVIQSAITGAEARITGRFTADETRTLALQLTGNAPLDTPRSQGPMGQTPASAAEAAVGERLAKMAELLQKHRTLEYESEGTLELSGEGLSVKATTGVIFAYEAPGKGRVEIKAPVGLRFVTVTDGETTWSYISAMKQYTRQPAAQSLSAMLSSSQNTDLAPLIAGLLATSLKTTPLPDETVTVGGRPRLCTVLETRLDTLNVPTPTPIAPIDFGFKNLVSRQWTDKELGVAVKSAATFQLAVGDAVIEFRIASALKTLRVDVPIAPGTFTFSPPKGAQEAPAFSSPMAAMPNLTSQPAPPFDVRDLDGKPYSLAALRGKPVLLDFWATWCAPCRQMMPTLDRIARDYRDQGLVVIGVDAGEDRPTVDAFLKATPAAYPTVLSRESNILASFQVVAYPTYVLIDSQGTIAAYRVGSMSEAEMRAMLQAAGLKPVGR